MGKMSRDKGSRFEREVAHQLTEWTGRQFRRTPMSGAYGGDWGLAGDIMCEPGAPHFPWTMELKNVEGWSLEQLATDTGPFGRWMDQAYGENRSRPTVTGSRNFPVLVFTKNRSLVYAALPHTADWAWSGGWNMAAFGFRVEVGGWNILRFRDILGCDPACILGPDWRKK